MARLRISLANKCQLMFGAAVLLIITAALSVPWIRMGKLVDEAQLEIVRLHAEPWLERLIPSDGVFLSSLELDSIDDPSVRSVKLMSYEESLTICKTAPLLAQAMAVFESTPTAKDFLQHDSDDTGKKHYYYVRAIWQSDVLVQRSDINKNESKIETGIDKLVAVMVVEIRADWATKHTFLNRVYIVTAGLLAGLLAIVVFWFITTGVILSPVRVLRDTAVKVAEGNLNIRSDINTGDEYEQLSNAFNSMLANLKENQDQMRTMNKQLDLRLGELAEKNVSLFEANQLKTDFLANVSHELRTPLNSIIGFAEVMRESIGENNDPESIKKLRYMDNILNSSQSLLRLITELLDLAKIEAGRVDLHIEPMSVADTCEGLMNLIRPQTDKKIIELYLDIEPNLPVIHSDAGKIQQIVFNFLSNAVKFTPDGGKIGLGAEGTTDDDNDGGVIEIRLWVADNGPGIPMESHEAIFEKFKQMDETHTKMHSGAGLGLAISRELAELLNARIELESDVGKGTKFTLIVPLDIEPKGQPLMPDLE